MEDKVYEPEVLEENPFPGGDTPTPISQRQVAGIFNPTIDKAKAFPIKRTAVELLSTALNTKSRKILGQFEFASSGAIQIGQFEDGVSGDLRITPNGLTARDIAGLTTFTVDGTTGDAVFKGKIQSGSLITGEVAVGNNRLILTVDSNNQPQIFLNDGSNDRVLIGFQSGGF